jgi:hypothetical protein
MKAGSNFVPSARRQLFHEQAVGGRALCSPNYSKDAIGTKASSTRKALITDESKYENAEDDQREHDVGAISFSDKSDHAENDARDGSSHEKKKAELHPVARIAGEDAEDNLFQFAQVCGFPMKRLIDGLDPSRLSQIENSSDQHDEGRNNHTGAEHQRDHLLEAFFFGFALRVVHLQLSGDSFDQHFHAQSNNRRRKKVTQVASGGAGQDSRSHK